MGDKDIISKDIFKRIAVDIARVLLHLKVDRAEIIDTEHERIEDRRADLVAQMFGADGEFIMHVEIQNGNETPMPTRMLRYRTDIMLSHPDQDIRQYLIYIGKAPLRMSDRIVQTGLDYRYCIVDMHTVDCQTLLAQDKPEALVLAILCNFNQRPEREVIHFIIHRLRQITADKEGRFREYMRMLEILSTNRNLADIITEEEKMLSQVLHSQLPSYQLGWEQGEIEGEIKGEIKGKADLLTRLLTRRFGPLDTDTQARLNHATQDQLAWWADNILDASTLEDVFKLN